MTFIDLVIKVVVLGLQIAAFLFLALTIYVASHPTEFLTVFSWYIIGICVWACVDSHLRKKYPERYESEIKKMRKG